MLRFLLTRPIAVLTSLVALLALSTVAYFNLPVSLLPDADVPEINLTVIYPNGSPQEVENNVLKTIRETMLTLSGVKDVTSSAHAERGLVRLTFEYGTNMNLAYIETNEKVDRMTQNLPRGVERPLVVKASTADIPVIRLQVIPHNERDMVNASRLVQNVLKRRIEQIDGVGVVDINGLQTEEIKIEPDRNKMATLGISDRDIISSIEMANLSLGAISVRNGNYRYFVKLAARVNTPEEIESLPIIHTDSSAQLTLKQIASVKLDRQKPAGFHLFNTKQAVGIAIHKQAQAKLPEMIATVSQLVEQFKVDYPQFDFFVTQDQSQLLTLSIQNLTQSILWGGAFAFGVLFLFMRGWREPLIMGIVLPISLLLSFPVFYLTGISLNTISLSGLVLGLGMLVDNSIVVIDNIILKRNEGNDLLESCIDGTKEVVAPLLSSAFTNLAVFLPLVFMSGLAGVLFFQQAVAVAAILLVSMLCTFILVPLLYFLFFNGRDTTAQDSKFFIGFKRLYERSFEWVWKRKGVTLLVFFSMIPVAVIIFLFIPKQGFPEISRTETLLKLRWTEPIDAEECKIRVSRLLNEYQSLFEYSESEVGRQQFLFSRSSVSLQEAVVYLKFNTVEAKQNADATIGKYLRETFPDIRFSLTAAPNAFERLFSKDNAQIELRLRSNTKRPIEMDVADTLLSRFNIGFQRGEGFEHEPIVEIRIKKVVASAYQVEPSEITNQLRIIFGDYLITDFRNFGESLPVVFSQAREDFETAIRGISVVSVNGTYYPLSELIDYSYKQHYKTITADESGLFQSILINDANEAIEVVDKLSAIVSESNLNGEFVGQWFEDQENLRQLSLILVISTFLMYFILTAEFESLKQPLLVMSSFPIGFAGSLVLLWITGGTIDVMSGIGMVVVLGIMDNDAILKVDRINRLRETMSLTDAIFQAGRDRFKPIVMNTCTNVLALTPILFTSGLGADLQRPVSVTTIGGLIVGTITALYYVPLVYWYFAKDTGK